MSAAGARSSQSAARKATAAEIEWLIGRLEEAGATLLALPHQGMGPRLRQVRWPESPGEIGDSGGTSGGRLRPAIPGAAEISRMDEAFGWIGLIPPERIVLRRIVHARSLVSPCTGRHLYSWRKLGVLLGADHKAVCRWHQQGIAAIASELAGLGKKSQLYT